MSVWGQPLGGPKPVSSQPAVSQGPTTASVVASGGPSMGNTTRSTAPKNVAPKHAAPKAVSAASMPGYDASSDAIDIFEGVSPVTCVEIEGVALLQIIKHCHENAPKSVTGSLLGMDNDDKTLEVTNSFPSPPHSEKKKESDEYQIEMMKNLREVGMDSNKVGWYQSVQMATFSTASVIQYQFQYQQSLGPNAICLIYDAAETTQGALSLKAFRLKKSFVNAYKAGVFTKESLAKEDVRSATMIEELPIKIHNADLIHCWLQEVAAQNNGAVAAHTFERLDLATNAYLENSLKNMGLWADELAQEHYKFQGYERALGKQRAAYQQWQARQRDENKARREAGEPLVPEEDPNFFKSLNQPSRLEALLITKQMNTYCEHINRYAGKSFQKLFLASKFQQDE